MKLTLSSVLLKDKDKNKLVFMVDLTHWEIGAQVGHEYRNLVISESQKDISDIE